MHQPGQPHCVPPGNFLTDSANMYQPGQPYRVRLGVHELALLLRRHLAYQSDRIYSLEFSGQIVEAESQCAPASPRGGTQRILSPLPASRLPRSRSESAFGRSKVGCAQGHAACVRRRMPACNPARLGPPAPLAGSSLAQDKYGHATVVLGHPLCLHVQGRDEAAPSVLPEAGQSAPCQQNVWLVQISGSTDLTSEHSAAPRVLPERTRARRPEYSSALPTACKKTSIGSAAHSCACIGRHE